MPAGALTPVAQRYSRLAIGANTRRTYEVSVKKFLTHRGDACPETVTNEEAANYLGHLAANSSLRASSLRGVKAALRSWWHEESGMPDRASPFESPIALAVLKGVRREKAPAEAKIRAAEPKRAYIGILALHRLSHLLEPSPAIRAPEPERLMIWAAATMGAAGLLRASEFIGSPEHPDRRVVPEQITFHSRTYGVMTPRPADESLCLYGSGMSYTISLGVTKADQHALNEAVEIDHPAAASALWRWSCTRLRIGAKGPELFRMPGAPKPLAMKTLLNAISQAWTSAGFGEIALTSRCFRRGGASELVAAGLPWAAIAARGRWASGREMVIRYAGPEALAERRTAEIALLD